MQHPSLQSIVVHQPSWPSSKPFEHLKYLMSGSVCIIGVQKHCHGEQEGILLSTSATLEIESPRLSKCFISRIKPWHCFLNLQENHSFPYWRIPYCANLTSMYVINPLDAIINTSETTTHSFRLSYKSWKVEIV